MSAGKPNKHQLKTMETRTLLLRAAKQVFVREGYAGAELGEIAAIAGRTKGAIYAQFESKEDIFMALIEEQALHHRDELALILAANTSVEQNIASYQAYCLNMLNDSAWNLLTLEFKLFAIRNPVARERFQKFQAKMISRDAEQRLTTLLGPDRQGHPPLPRSLSVQVMMPLLSALNLESIFDPEALSGDARLHIAQRILDALVTVPTPAAPCSAGTPPPQRRRTKRTA